MVIIHNRVKSITDGKKINDDEKIILGTVVKK